jgi:hypothetical protein
MRKLFIIAAMALGLFAVGCDDDFTPPAQLSTSFYDTYPNAVDVEWEWKRGRKYRVAEFKQNGDVLILGDFFWRAELWEFAIEFGAGVAETDAEEDILWRVI